MGLAGQIGAGAAEGLEDVLMRQLREAVAAEQVRSNLAQEGLRGQALAQDQSQHSDVMGLRTREQDMRERIAQEESEQQGVDMLRDDQARSTMRLDKLQQQEDITDAASDESIPAPVRRMLGVFGRTGQKVAPGDLLTEDEIAVRNKADDDRKVSLAGRTAEAAAAAAARHRPSSDGKRHPHMVNGRIVYLTEDEVNARGGVQPTERQRSVSGQERTNLGFFQRAAQADEITAPLEADIAKMGLAGQARLEYMPNFLQSDKGQAYRQAQRAFTEARLRKESGAAIPDSEYANDARTYFAMPGDKPETIAQKQAARQQVMESLALSSGEAWEEYYGAPREPGARPEGMYPAGGETKTVNGVTYVKKNGPNGLGWYKQ